MKAGAISAALFGALAVIAGSAAGGEKAAGPWVVVQSDGARVVFDSPPERKGTRLVGRLLSGGALVSLPLARIDEAATRAANEPGAPKPTPPPAATPAPRPFETPPLGNLVKLRTSAEEARAHIEGAMKGTPAPSRPAREVPPVAVAEPTDLLGRGERYWRERADERREALEAAAADRQVAERTLAEAERAWLGVSEAETTTYVLYLLEARERAERARQRHLGEQQRWEELGEEARKAGAFPGWLR
ncbi:MAG TPA: hypothetical protein PKA62_10470 [Thermoanaerobaculia bacterium]|nr:hypothetical protein [Thermoanaerobaculia bacterium]